MPTTNGYVSPFSCLCEVIPLTSLLSPVYKWLVVTSYLRFYNNVFNIHEEKLCISMHANLPSN